MPTPMRLCDQELSDNLCVFVYCYGIHSRKLRQSLNCENGPYNPRVTEAGALSQVVHGDVLFQNSEFVRQRLSPQLLHEDSICGSNEKEQRPDRHVHKNGAAVLCRNPKHSPTEWHPHCCTTITIIICGPTSSIVLFFLLLLLLALLCPSWTASSSLSLTTATIASTRPTPLHSIQQR